MDIRDYDSSTDLQGLYRCVISIQDFERNLIPSMPKGVDICVEYVKSMMEQCAKYSGKVMVATEASTIIGYVTVFVRMVSDDIEDGDEEYAYIADLIVLEEHRGNGKGKKLMAAAEAYARDSGSKKIRIGVLSDNKSAVKLYRNLEYKPFAMQLEKTL